MENKYLNITNDNYEASSYKRGIFRGDKIQDFYFYKEYDVTISKKGNYIEDRYFTYLLDNKYIDKNTYDQYNEKLQEYFSDIDRLDPYGIEDIYEDLLSIRNNYFKDEIVTKVYKEIDGFNQEVLFFELLKDKDSVIMILDDINEKELFEYYRNKIDKDVYVLKSDCCSINLNRLAYDEKLQKDIDNNKCLLLVFGEAGFLVCRDLKIDSFVIGDAISLPTRYFLNCSKGNHFIYVPKDFNIQKYTFIVRPSTLTYSQLYYLYKDKGFDIYQNIDRLSELYPEYFDNIYQNDGRMIKMPDLNKYNYQKVNYEDDQGRVIMHTVKLDKPYDVKVIKNYDKKPMHELLSDVKGTYLVCNFLFFTTFKLMKFYNFQRSDRPDEMIDYSHFGHLDYMKDNGFASIPLYNKATFIVNNDNEILFRHLSKESGCFYIDDDKYCFDESNYNCEDDKDLIIYIPSYSIDDEDSNNYIKEVGKDRFNIVMIQEHVICAKKGGVLLPCIGYVISLKDERSFEKIKVELDTSKDYKLAYGGGMMLIDKGRDFVIDDFVKEGWMSPLSKLSQDTSMEKLDWNPRCSLGLLKDGAFTINVFDGRNEETPGATYKQMCNVVRKTYPDIDYLLNVDGGASSFLGIVKDGVFKEISRPSTAADNISGQARDVMTVLLLRVED